MSTVLDARLRAVASAVRPGSVAADVGTDHGYLICALVEEGRCPRGYASDINPAPLASARAHIRRQGLQDRITTLLSDGLQALPGDDIDDVILAGMGGEQMAALLTAVPWTRNPDKRFVLQPMTRAAVLRRQLYRSGFALLEETAAISGRFAYTIMTAAYTGTPRDIDDRFAVAGLHRVADSDAAARYLQRERRRLLRQAEGMERAAHSQERAQKLRRLADQITGKDKDAL